MKTFDINENDINNVMENTHDAYMRDSFPDSEWQKAVEYLLNKGYSTVEASVELNSKSARWATACNHDGEKARGDYLGEWLIDYYETGNNFVKPQGIDNIDDVLLKNF